MKTKIEKSKILSQFLFWFFLLVYLVIPLVLVGIDVLENKTIGNTLTGNKAMVENGPGPFLFFLISSFIIVAILSFRQIRKTFPKNAVGAFKFLIIPTISLVLLFILQGAHSLQYALKQNGLIIILSFLIYFTVSIYQGKKGTSYAFSSPRSFKRQMGSIGFTLALFFIILPILLTDLLKIMTDSLIFNLAIVASFIIAIIANTRNYFVYSKLENQQSEI